MATISLINPLDQPTGRSRLIEHLVEGMRDKEFTRFRLIVAFAKAGPLLRMQRVIETSREKGLKIEAMFGVDQLGTSAQALRFAMNNFDNVYVVREANLTFHPKMYAFDGEEKARLYIGSNNLTVGGTETNFETAIRIDLRLPPDAKTFQLFSDSWKEMLPATCPATKRLTEKMLSELISDGTVPDETSMRRVVAVGATGASVPKSLRSGLKVKPASSLPAKKVSPSKANSKTATTSSASPFPITSVADPFTAQGLAIQIKPHKNGEIFLSVRAALQNPAFFKWPFTGTTVPKKGSNAGYPQLTPDPHVKITVYGKKVEPLLLLPDYQLNTVYYATNSEIRITASPLVNVVPAYSIMIIRQAEVPSLDYEITVHTPASPEFSEWLAVCKQTMPGGGSTPRKFGWF